MYCTACGAPLTGGRFCGGCGAPVAQTMPTTPSVPAPMARPTEARAPTMTPVPAWSVGSYPWDYARDLGAAAVLIWSLGLPWSYSHAASSVVYVLLTTLCALFSLAVLPLSRFLRNPDGSPFAWPTLAIRSLMCTQDCSRTGVLATDSGVAGRCLGGGDGHGLGRRGGEQSLGVLRPVAADGRCRSGERPAGRWSRRR